MTAINPNETAKSWRTQTSEAAVQLYLSGAEGDAAALVGVRVGGFPLHFNLVPVNNWINPDELSSAAVGVVQVDRDSSASIQRFGKLAAATETPLIAAAYDPPLALVRALIRAGAHDVIPLPLDVAELETSLAPIRDSLASQRATAPTAAGKVVTAIKSVGGAGATALLGQLAVRFAEREAQAGREACLIDLDVQFGNAAFQLGLKPSLSVGDVLDAGSRLDGDLLRSIAAPHSSGLKVIAGPPVMMPLEALTSEQSLELIEVAGREFGTVFVDLPASWTNWSLSLLARSDLALLITELSVTSLQRARRQLHLIEAQDLKDLNLWVVINRFEKSLFRTIKPADVRQALGREIAYTVANEPAVMRPALEQGIPIAEVKRRSALGRDIDQLEAGIAGALGLER